MLKGIPPLLKPDLLHALAGTVHNDRSATVDANARAARCARRLIGGLGADGLTAGNIVRIGEPRFDGTVPLAKGVIPP